MTRFRILPKPTPSKPASCDATTSVRNIRTGRPRTVPFSFLGPATSITWHGNVEPHLALGTKAQGSSHVIRQQIRDAGPPTDGRQGSARPRQHAATDERPVLPDERASCRQPPRRTE